MKHPFEIQHNAITFYPNHLWKRLGYTLLITFLVLSFGLFYYFQMLTPVVGLIMVLFMFAIFFPFIYVGSRTLTLDSNTGMITRRSLFGEKVIGPLSDFGGTSFVTDATFGAQGSGYYRLVYKERPYSKGVRLHTSLRANSQQLTAVKATALPYLSQMLLQHSTGIPSKEVTVKVFRHNGHAYTASLLKPVNLILGFGLVAGGIYFQQNPLENNGWIWIALVIGGLLNLVMATGKVRIDTNARTIEKSFVFGLYKKTFQFSQLNGFNTMRYLAYGLFHNGTDINMDVTRENGSVQRVVLFHRIQRASKLEALMAELHHILRS